jgi:hypothetical protein
VLIKDQQVQNRSSLIEEGNFYFIFMEEEKSTAQFTITTNQNNLEERGKSKPLTCQRVRQDTRIQSKEGKGSREMNCSGFVGLWQLLNPKKSTQDAYNSWVKKISILLAHAGIYYITSF